jgi:hypothetical protein
MGPQAADKKKILQSANLMIGAAATRMNGKGRQILSRLVDRPPVVTDSQRFHVEH